MRVVWEYLVDPDSGCWIGVCEELNLNAVGDTLTECLQCSGEAMQLLGRDLTQDEANELVRRIGHHKEGA